MVDALTQATFGVSEESLRRMILEREELPPEVREFEPVRQGALDNATMAAQGFLGHTAESLRSHGRLTGYLREFASPLPDALWRPGTDIVAATVVHLFESREAVSAWMAEVFLKQFQESVGKPMGPDQELVAARPLPAQGFHDETAALHAVHRGATGLVSSTVVDFRVGRLLGVAFVVTLGEVARRRLAQRLGLDLERRMVRVVLGAG